MSLVSSPVLISALLDHSRFIQAAEKVAEDTEKRFKILTQENQRFRTTLQSIRLGAQNGVMRFEKEKDKLLSKIADSKQTVQFACSNLNVGMTQGVFENGYPDIVLEDAENARVNLAGGE